jgi:hypothetical protein
MPSARRRKKESEEQETAPTGEVANEVTGSAPAEQREPDVFDLAIAERQRQEAERAKRAEAPPPQTQDAPAGAQEAEPPADDTAQQKQWADQGPRGIASIDLGDGRRIHFIRNNAMQQVGITFAAKEGVDPRPSKEDTQFLKDHGFRWRGGEKIWTRQFFTPEDKEHLGKVEAEQGQQQARVERGRIRVRVMSEAEGVFEALANTIRQRNGLEPSQLSFSRDEGRGL